MTFTFIKSVQVMAKKETPKKKQLHPKILQVAKKLERIRIENGYTSYENFAIEHGINAVLAHGEGYQLYL